jgi:SAM-dependent methyltransferase
MFTQFPSVPGWTPRSSGPGSTNVVLEIDPLLIEVGEKELGLVRGPDLRVITGDARLAIADLETNSYDLIVGDVFGGLAVLWHLTTTEFVTELDRVLRPDGLYLMNVIDGGEKRFTEAELATLAQHVDHLGVVVRSDRPVEAGAANQILLGSDAELPAIEVDPVPRPRCRRRGGLHRRCRGATRRLRLG